MQLIAVYLIPEASSPVTGPVFSDLFAKRYNDHVAKGDRGGRENGCNLHVSTAEMYLFWQKVISEYDLVIRK